VPIGTLVKLFAHERFATFIGRSRLVLSGSLLDRLACGDHGARVPDTPPCAREVLEKQTGNGLLDDFFDTRGWPIRLTKVLDATQDLRLPRRARGID